MPLAGISYQQKCNIVNQFDLFITNVLLISDMLPSPFSDFWRLHNPRLFVLGTPQPQNNNTIYEFRLAAYSAFILHSKSIQGDLYGIVNTIKFGS